jgi:photoactive yellow protein
MPASPMLRPHLLEPLFDALPIGVVVLDREGKVVVFNKHEEVLAGRNRERVLGRSFFAEIAPCMDVRELAGAFRDRVGQRTLDERVEIEFAFPHAESPRAVVCRLKSFVADDEPFGMLLVEDVSMQHAVEHMKTTLANLLVHDLKNPLAVVLANVDFARSRIARLKDAPPRVPDALEEARSAGWRLHAMILDLLDVARMQTGTFPLQRKQTNLGALLREAVDAYRFAAERDGKRLVLDAPETLDALVDAPVIRRVIDNLVENAVRHSPRNTEVRVRATPDRDAALIDVVDAGPGIPPELRDRIFDPYVQAQGDGRELARSNRGLGLTLVQMAVRAHGGDVSVLDNPPQGAIFRVRLPLG